MAESGAAGMLAEDKMGFGDANQRWSHDLVAEGVGQHAVLVDAGLVGKGVVAHDSLVWRGPEGDDLPQYLAGGIKYLKIEAVGDAVAVAANVEDGGDLFEGCVAGALPDAVDGAFDLTCAVLNRGEGVGDGEAQVRWEERR